MLRWFVMIFLPGKDPAYKRCHQLGRRYGITINFIPKKK